MIYTCVNCFTEIKEYATGEMTTGLQLLSVFLVGD